MQYYEASGKIDFNEGVPGLAAYCALGTIIVSRSVKPAEPGLLFQKRSPGEKPPVPKAVPGKNQTEDLISERVTQSALGIFPESSRALPLMETFCRIALSMTDRLNPDLLTESLIARRAGFGDLKRLGQELESLAQGERALKEAVFIRQALEPGYTPGEAGGRVDSRAGGNTAGEDSEGDPWVVMGLKPGASMEEIKSSFRKLAALYHPDVLQSLDEEHQQSATKAFILIKEAYRKLLCTAQSSG
ncbi:MAG: J domain-containing protein [Treponema sp.]|nr:J domain-containing protein [Treponema sp.]